MRGSVPGGLARGGLRAGVPSSAVLAEVHGGEMDGIDTQVSLLPEVSLGSTTKILELEMESSRSAWSQTNRGKPFLSRRICGTTQQVIRQSQSGLLNRKESENYLSALASTSILRRIGTPRMIPRGDPSSVDIVVVLGEETEEGPQAENIHPVASSLVYRRLLLNKSRIWAGTEVTPYTCTQPGTTSKST